MTRQSVIELIKADPEAHGVYEEPQEERRQVYCRVYSIGTTEHYELRSHGYEPGCKVELSDYAEYQGEQQCLLEGRLYRIERTYITERMTIELTLVRDDHDEIRRAAAGA